MKRPCGRKEEVNSYAWRIMNLAREVGQSGDVNRGNQEASSWHVQIHEDCVGEDCMCVFACMCMHIFAWERTCVDRKLISGTVLDSSFTFFGERVSSGKPRDLQYS